MNLELFTSHGFDISPEESALYERFLTLFMEYNTHTNLSAIRDEEGITEKHFVDSLYGASIIGESLDSRHVDHRRHLAQEVIGQDSPTRGVLTISQTPNDGAVRLLDIGSGWGFPGIPLKIVLPDIQITLLDSIGKKVKAMNHFIQELWLAHITAVQARAEDLAKDSFHKGQYDFVVSRATAYISDILYWARPFLRKWGKIVLYKMPSDEEKKDREKTLKKLGLVLEGELTYLLAGKERVRYVIATK